MAPKYQSIADSLRQEIETGVYSSKQLLPTEHLLCQRFQISRQTVRRALSVLEDEGLITRRQGSGSHLRERAEPGGAAELYGGGGYNLYQRLYFPRDFAGDGDGAHRKQQRPSALCHAKPSFGGAQDTSDPVDDKGSGRRSD